MTYIKNLKIYIRKYIFTNKHFKRFETEINKLKKAYGPPLKSGIDSCFQID